MKADKAKKAKEPEKMKGATEVEKAKVSGKKEETIKTEKKEEAMKTETTENQVAEAATEEISGEELDKLIRHHVYGSMAIGLIPVPLADFAGVTLIQLNLLRVLAKKYNVPFSNGIVKNILSPLVGGIVPAAVAGPLAVSISKFVPAIGVTAGVVSMPIVAGASTYAVGKVFVQHFASGGTFLTFDPEKVRAYYTEMFVEGKKIAAVANAK